MATSVGCGRRGRECPTDTHLRGPERGLQRTQGLSSTALGDEEVGSVDLHPRLHQRSLAEGFAEDRGSVLQQHESLRRTPAVTYHPRQRQERRTVHVRASLGRGVEDPHGLRDRHRTVLGAAPG